MKLVIAEKPSLARAIAGALPGSSVSKDGYIECGGEYVVTWCVGHLLSQKMPEDYNDEYKVWTNRPVPFVPERWEYKAGKGKAQQLKVVSSLVKKASVIINAGDPDREGSHLVDIVVQVSGGSEKPIWRLLVADLNPAAVKKSVAKMDQYNSTENLSKSALARSRGDYIYGLNLTSAYTIAAKKNGYAGSVLSIGRVQTPILGLLVRRKKERENFEPHKFFAIGAHLEKDSIEFSAGMKIECPESYLDDSNRLVDRNYAQELKDSVTGKPAVVSSIESEEKKGRAPNPFSLSGLQKVANKAFGLTAQETLSIAQELYEKQYTTYPRSDCEYISSEIWSDADNVLSAVKQSEWADMTEGTDSAKKHSCVNNSKVGAHHAIIPTTNVPSELSGKSKSLYELILKRYLALFMPEARDQKTVASIDIGGKKFLAKGVVEVEKGWRKLLGGSPKSAVLPNLKQGEEIPIKGIELIEKETTPPEEFTEAALLTAMTGIAKYVSEEIRAVLKDTDGLGTEATRAAMIETLMKREFAKREGKKIRPTEKGVEFIEQLPEEVVTPDMTALWESQLADIARGESTVESFLKSVIEKTTELVQSPDIKITGNLKEKIPCPRCGEELRKTSNTNGSYWFCTAPKEKCEFTCMDNRGKPAEKTAHDCPECSKPLRRRKNDKGWFWGCTGFKEAGCKYIVSDSKGKPGKKEEKGDKKSAVETDHKCPECSKPMIKRAGKWGDFLGCSGFPGCKKTIKLDESGQPITA